VPAHLGSVDYSVQEFLDDPEFISHVVRFDLPLLGDVTGLRGVHLQCHIGQPLVSDSPETYVATDAVIKHGVTHQWNHGIGEIVTALFDEGMAMTGLVEHMSTPFEALPGQMVEGGGGEWQLAEDPERVPCTFTLQAVRQA
jgi:hypothetical protein